MNIMIHSSVMSALATLAAAEPDGEAPSLLRSSREYPRLDVPSIKESVYPEPPPRPRPDRREQRAANKRVSARVRC